MNSKKIEASIDLSKIDPGKISTHSTRGGKFLKLTMYLNETPDKYGNTLVIQEKQTPKEITTRAPKTYLGKGKVVKKIKSAPCRDPHKLPF